MRLARELARDLFGEPQKVLTCANMKETALLPWRHVARRCHEWRAVPRYQVGAERIEWPAGDYGEPAGTWLVQAANQNAGVGHSCGLIVVDEAWSVDRAPSWRDRLRRRSSSGSRRSYG